MRMAISESDNQGICADQYHWSNRQPESVEPTTLAEISSEQQQQQQHQTDSTTTATMEYGWLEPKRDPIVTDTNLAEIDFEHFRNEDLAYAFSCGVSSFLQKLTKFLQSSHGKSSLKMFIL